MPSLRSTINPVMKKENLAKNVTIRRDVVLSRHPWSKTMQIKHEWKELCPFKDIGGELCIEIMTSHGQTMQTKYGWEKFFLLKGKIRSLYLSHQPLIHMGAYIEFIIPLGLLKITLCGRCNVYWVFGFN